MTDTAELFVKMYAYFNGFSVTTNMLILIGNILVYIGILREKEKK